MSSYEGKLCVVTGASRGIGHAVTKLLLERGADVVATSFSRRGIEDLIEAYPNLTFLEGDMRKIDDIEKLADTVRDLNRTVYAVFPVVGGGPDTTITSTPEDIFDDVLARNLKSSFFTVQNMLPMMEAGSSVVLFASIAGQQGGHDSVVYNAAKAAVRSFGKTFATELGPRGIRVNVLSPGPTDTDGFREYIHNDADRLRSIEQVSVLGRVGIPRETAQAALFLGSDEASFITGAELIVDGGFLVS